METMSREIEIVDMPATILASVSERVASGDFSKAAGGT